MGTTKKIISAIVMVLSVVFLIAMLSGIGGVWWARGEVVRISTNLTDVADRNLGRAQGVVAQADQVVQTSKNAIDLLSTRIQSAGASEAQISAALTAADTVFNGVIGPAVQQINNRAQDVRDTGDNINQTLSFIPFISDGNDSQISGVTDTIADRTMTLAQSVTDIQQAIQTAKSAPPDQVAGILSQPLANGSGNLGLLSDDLGQITQRIEQARQNLIDRRDRINNRLTLIAIGLTFGFLWLALGQVGLFIYAYGIFTARSPWAHWHI